MKFTEFCDLMKKYPNEKVQVFIDLPNLYRAVKEHYPDHTADADKVATKLVAGRKLIRINIYTSQLSHQWEPDNAKAQQAYLYSIQEIPFVRVSTQKLRYSKNGKHKWEKGIDVLLATDMLSQAYFGGYDSMILISGDGDYAPVLQKIRIFGKRVENAFIVSNRANALKNACDIFVDLDDAFLKDCLRKKSTPQS